MAVGLEEGYLNSLCTDYPTCQERFNQVFIKWSQTDPDSFTWGTVIKVLQSDTIKAHELVESIISCKSLKFVLIVCFDISISPLFITYYPFYHLSICSLSLVNHGKS